MHGVIITFCSISRISRNSWKTSLSTLQRLCYRPKTINDLKPHNHNPITFTSRNMSFYIISKWFLYVSKKGPVCGIQWHLMAERCTARNLDLRSQFDVVLELSSFPAMASFEPRRGDQNHNIWFDLPLKTGPPLPPSLSPKHVWPITLMEAINT